MDFKEKIGCGLVTLILVVLLGFGVASVTPGGRAWLNTWGYNLQKVDDATTYHTRKQVEDTCRATIVSYEADKLTWEQYKDSPDEEQRSWADAALMRANKAALTYNEYFLKNSFVFEGNVPADIRTDLPVLRE